MNTTYAEAIDKVGKWLFNCIMLMQPIDYEPLKEHVLLTVGYMFEVDTNTVNRDLHVKMLTLRKSELH